MGIKDVIENEFSPQNREGTMVGAVTAPHPYWIANILVANTPSVVAIFLDARPSASRLPDPPPLLSCLQNLLRAAGLFAGAILFMRNFGEQMAI